MMENLKVCYFINISLKSNYGICFAWGTGGISRLYYGKFVQCLITYGINWELILWEVNNLAGVELVEVVFVRVDKEVSRVAQHCSLNVYLFLIWLLKPQISFDV